MWIERCLDLIAKRPEVEADMEEDDLLEPQVVVPPKQVENAETGEMEEVEQEQPERVKKEWRNPL